MASKAWRLRRCIIKVDIDHWKLPPISWAVARQQRCEAFVYSWPTPGATADVTTKRASNRWRVGNMKPIVHDRSTEKRPPTLSIPHCEHFQPPSTREACFAVVLPVGASQDRHELHQEESASPSPTLLRGSTTALFP